MVIGTVPSDCCPTLVVVDTDAAKGDVAYLADVTPGRPHRFTKTGHPCEHGCPVAHHRKPF